MLDRRTALFALLYASEGAPIGFIWWALPTLLRTAGVGIADITALTAVLVLPWVFKFLWAPLIDVLRGPRWGYRSWIVAMQSAMALSLVPLIWLDPVGDLGTWRNLLLIHAVAAATQDIAIDALAIGAVPSDARGRLNGAMQAGMLTGRSLFGGGAVAVAAVLGLNWLVIALIVWILAALLALAILGDAAQTPALAGSSCTGRQAFMNMFRQRATWLGLAFALTSGAAFEATGQLAGPFLVDRGLAAGTIGAFLGLVVVAALLVGGLVGGMLSDSWGRVRSVGIFLIGIVTMVVLLAVVDQSGAATDGLRLGLLAGMYFFVGLFTAASYALFMDLTDPRIGATQFTTFMAATNGCESWSAWSGGRLAATQGYPAAFLWLSLASVLSLPLLAWIRRDVTRPSAPPAPPPVH